MEKYLDVNNPDLEMQECNQFSGPLDPTLPKSSPPKEPKLSTLSLLPELGCRKPIKFKISRRAKVAKQSLCHPDSQILHFQMENFLKLQFKSASDRKFKVLTEYAATCRDANVLEILKETMPKLQVQDSEKETMKDKNFTRNSMAIINRINETNPVFCNSTASCGTWTGLQVWKNFQRSHYGLIQQRKRSKRISSLKPESGRIPVCIFGSKEEAKIMLETSSVDYNNNSSFINGNGDTSSSNTTSKSAVEGHSSVINISSGSAPEEEEDLDILELSVSKEELARDKWIFV